MAATGVPLGVGALTRMPAVWPNGRTHAHAARLRAPGAHAARAAHELADRIAQAAAAGALVAALLDHERLAQPGLDLVVDDQPRERERRRRQGDELGASERL